MNKAKQRYQKKVTRKYVDIYPTECAIIDYINKRKAEGINFATLVKALLALEAYKDAVQRADVSLQTVTRDCITKLDEVIINESK